MKNKVIQKVGSAVCRTVTLCSVFFLMLLVAGVVSGTEITGTLNHIDVRSVTVDDYEYTLIPQTLFLDNEGNQVDKENFVIDMVVMLRYKDQDKVVSELSFGEDEEYRDISEEDVEVGADADTFSFPAQEPPPHKKRGGEVKLEGGVYVN